MIGVERVEEYVFWAVTGAIGLLISALTFFVKRGMDKKDARDKEQDKRITEVEDKLNNAINQMPFLYTLREDFIRSNAQQNQKLDQIITLLMERPANKSQVEISGFGSSEKGNTKSSR